MVGLRSERFVSGRTTRRRFLAGVAVAGAMPGVVPALAATMSTPAASEEEPMTTPKRLVTGLVMGEAPRWHDGRLWFSDFGAREVLAVDLAGEREVVARVLALGLGFLPDGRLLIAATAEGRLLRREPGGALATHADMSALSGKPWNDLVVDGRGNAYVNNIGFDFPEGEFVLGTIALVSADGAVSQVADGLAFPNGMAVTPDNATLIVAESYGNRLTAFDIAADGGLSNRRVWADLGDGAPDGICLDADGAVWYGDVPNKRCVRVREGGDVVRMVDLDRGCFACMLGGEEGRTLFMMAAAWGDIETGAAGSPTGQVLTVEVATPGVGWP